MTVPYEIRTKRLFLRPWRAEDADALQPVLAANWEHLSPWIPARVAEPAPVPVLAERLAQTNADFAADREWRYGIFLAEGGDVLGELALFPRAESGRVPYGEADRAELGYWIRSDMTGQGLVSEAARAVLDVAINLPQVSLVEIRCDARNRPSAAIPRRLGFGLAQTITTPAATPAESDKELQVWALECSNTSAPRT